ncbi:MAG: anhydro-N-acetylmuramic acid kinase [Alphaproteobacteria bacterium]
MRVAGLLSGTSMDGLDVALCHVEVAGPPDAPAIAATLDHFDTVAFPPSLATRLAAFDRLDLAELAALDADLGRWQADAVAARCRAHGFAPELIGSHGQTVYHDHGEVSWQLGEASFLAAALGCPVVHGFRQGDIAVGGAGAPLVPFVDWALLRSAKEDRAALNLGGIANLTLLPHAGAPAGFDVGPGNMVIDELARRATGGAVSRDEDGAFAARGHIDEAEVERLLAHPFLMTPPPKSCGREQFGAGFVDAWLDAQPPAGEQDWCDRIATATAWTAAAVARDLAAYAPATRRLLVSGGGVHNPALTAALAHRLDHQVILERTDAYGLPVDAKEALAFAILAACRLARVPANLPSATGAARPALLGSVCEV